MKALSIFMIIGLISVSAIAQNEEKYLHLFMGYQKAPGKLNKRELQYDDPALANYYYKILWRLEKDKLSIVDTLNWNFNISSYLHDLHHFPFQKWMLFEEGYTLNKQNLLRFNRVSQFPKCVSILDYSGDTLVLRKADEDLLPFIVSSRRVSGMLNTIRYGILVYYETVASKPVYQRFAIDKYWNRYQLDVEDFQHIIDYGNTRPDWHGGYALSYTFKGNGKLRIGLRLDSNDISNNPLALLQVPDRLKLERARLVIVISKPDFHYLVTRPEFYDQSKNDSLGNQIWIFDQQIKKWEIVNLPGDFSLIANYNEWLYGTRKDRYDIKAAKDSFNIWEVEYQYRYSGKYGEAPPLYAGYTGILYLYHIPSKKLITWDTKDRDSELLTIKDGWIYYRVFDELRRVPLDEVALYIRWREEEVLVKDCDVIPHVHEIFWAKKSPLKIEWVTPKPEYMD
jgi:hypothetical protein